MTTTSNEPPVTDAIGTQSDPPGSDATEVLPSVGTDADDDGGGASKASSPTNEERIAS